MANTLYTAQDMKKAMNVGKRSFSFQYIEGQQPKTHLNGDMGFALDALQYEIGFVLTNAILEEDVEKLAEDIKKNILVYYKFYKKES